MESNIIKEINSIFNNEKNEDNVISLFEIIEFINDLKKEYEKSIRVVIKKMNRKLGKTLTFFNYEVKKINLSDKIEITINHELETKMFFISKTGKCDMSIDLQKVLLDEFNVIIKAYNEFLNLINIKIKTKIENLDVYINNYAIEVSALKSKNWITMGKAFNLKYDIFKNDFNYEIDNINLKKFLNEKENDLFKKIYIKINLLPNDFQLKYEVYLNKKMENKNNLFFLLKKRLQNLMKKK